MTSFNSIPGTTPFYCRAHSFSSCGYDSIPISENVPLIRRQQQQPYNQCLYLVGLLLIFIVGTGIGSYLLYSEMENNETEDFNLILRKYWDPVSTNLKMPQLEFPIEKILLTTTGTNRCVYKTDCFSILRTLKEKHIRSNFTDLTYNFVMSSDGRVYEGRGWTYQPDCSHCDNKTISLAFIGNDRMAIGLDQQEELKAFLDYSTSNNRMAKCYEVLTTYQETRYLTDAVLRLKRKNKNFCT